MIVAGLLLFLAACGGTAETAHPSSASGPDRHDRTERAATQDPNPGTARTAAPPAESAAAAQKSPPGPQASPGSIFSDSLATTTGSYTVAGEGIELVTENNGCWLLHGDKTDASQRIDLELRPPCYLLTWQKHPSLKAAGATGTNDGFALGDIGEPLARKYRIGGGTVLIVVIGNPFSSAQLADSHVRWHMEHGYRCASSARGVLLQGHNLSLSKERFESNLFCVEYELDHKQLWLLSHER